MSWALGSWKRPSDSFRLSLFYGESAANYQHSAEKSIPNNNSSSTSSPEISMSLKSNKIELEWSSSEDEEQAALRLQSQLIVALPPPQEHVQVEMHPMVCGEGIDVEGVEVGLNVIKRREPLVVMSLSKALGSGQQSDGVGVIARMLRSCTNYHWGSTITVLNLSFCGISVLPLEINQLPLLQDLYLDNNKLSFLPSELGELKFLRVLRADHNTLTLVPGLNLSNVLV